MSSKVVRTSTGTVTETRSVNALNLVTQNAIDDGATFVTWASGWDDNGNMTSKANGTAEVWTYVWNEDNRLAKVEKVESGTTTLDVRYTYDSIGRLLTRKLLTDTDPTRFEWDGWDLVREVDAAGVETVYYAPQGEITSFKRGSSVYQVCGDALGSCRVVTDPGGGIVAETDLDAWGHPLSTSGPSSIASSLRFLGAVGVRWDDDVGLYYTRQRWYDSGLGRFVSRDRVDSDNRYNYAASNPTTLTDSNGFDWCCASTRSTDRRQLELPIGTSLG